MQTLIFLPLQEAVLHMREIVIIRVIIILTPPVFTPLRTCGDRTV